MNYQVWQKILSSHTTSAHIHNKMQLWS